MSSPILTLLFPPLNTLGVKLTEFMEVSSWVFRTRGYELQE